MAFPVAVAGVVSLVGNRALRPLGWTVVGTVVVYFALGGKSYYALPVVLFALAAGAIPLDRWATHRRLQLASALFAVIGLLALPVAPPVLPLHTAVRLGIVKARSDYQSEVGWPWLADTAGVRRANWTASASLADLPLHRAEPSPPLMKTSRSGSPAPAFGNDARGASSRAEAVDRGSPSSTVDRCLTRPRPYI